MRNTFVLSLSWKKIVGPIIMGGGANIMNPRLSIKNVTGSTLAYQSIVKQYLQRSMINILNNIYDT